MFVAKTLSFYKNLDIRRAMIQAARDKEIAVHYGKHFGKRPEVLYGEGDVLDFAKKKATSFHASEELWDNPLFIKTGMSQKEINDLRKGWDLILDIDCPYWPLSKLITHLFIKALVEHGIKSVTVKFSGNKGFHIAVPFEAFPYEFNGQPTKDLFPEAPRRIAYYLLDYISNNYVEEKEEYFVFDKRFKIEKKLLAEKLGKESLNAFSTTHYFDGKNNELTEDEAKRFLNKKTYLLCGICGQVQTAEEQGEVQKCPRCNSFMQEQTAKGKTVRTESTFDPLTIIEVDTILIAHRHLYRMPYSFHEKSELVSVPVKPKDVLHFDKKSAETEKIDLTIPFLEREKAITGEASKLLIAAYDYEPKVEGDVALETKKTYEIPEEAIPEEYFPPCILAMLKGLKDGRKRAMFTLINFLRGCGWEHEKIDETLHEWNKKNDELLREVELKGRLRYEKTKKEALPPHNCKRYYQDFAVCQPDNLCNGIKNPLQYAKKKAALAGVGVEGKGKREKLTEEQKAARRAYKAKQKEAEVTEEENS